MNAEKKLEYNLATLLSLTPLVNDGQHRIRCVEVGVCVCVWCVFCCFWFWFWFWFFSYFCFLVKLFFLDSHQYFSH
jgi:hypothetical protein